MLSSWIKFGKMLKSQKMIKILKKFNKKLKRIVLMLLRIIPKNALLSKFLSFWEILIIIRSLIVIFY